MGIDLIVGWFCEYLHCDPLSQQGQQVRKFIEEKMQKLQKIEEKYEYRDFTLDCEDAVTDWYDEDG